MNRRDIIRLPLASLASARLSSAAGFRDALTGYFRTITGGFIENCRRTSPSFAVCDFKDGTILPGAVGRSGKTYDSVSRMMPALAAWVASGRDPGIVPGARLDEVLRQTLSNAFDPGHPDFWMPSPAKQQQQRQVESSIVAWSAWLLRDTVLPKLSPKQRENLQAWLASCTQVPVRNNNWAWFTALNQAVRIALAGRFPEFSGDENWMLDDLRVLDRMALPGNEGWYTDSLKEKAYDYYNFWVFASHFLYWNRVVGDRYKDWSSRFGARLSSFLNTTPMFFGGNGCHILFGRSLIYRWAVLTPLVLAHEQKLWPHSPGLLRRIVRGNLDYLWGVGAYDPERGKLRETFSRGGNRDICDSYIDNGHPYWGMQAFGFWLIPDSDPFWSAPEEPLPVERRDFQVSLPATGMVLAGAKRTGHVRWLQSNVANRSIESRDKYSKFSYSSHFPFNILKLKDQCAWDANLVFRDPVTGAVAGIEQLRRGALIPGGVEREWTAKIGDLRFEIHSRITVQDELERRVHTIIVPGEAIERKMEAIEGSYALGLEEGETPIRKQEAGWQWLASRRTGFAVATWNRNGFERLETAESFGENGRKNLNSIYPRMAVNTLRVVMTAEKMILESVHYSSPKPLAFEAVRKAAAKWR